MDPGMPQYLLPAPSAAASRTPPEFGLGPFVGVCVLLGIGGRHLSRLTQRWRLNTGEFLQSEGVVKPKSIVEQLRGQGIASYADMHLAHLRGQHQWLLDVPAPNRTRIVQHLQSSTTHLLGTLALPAAGLVFGLRQSLADVLYTVTAPIGALAVAAVQHSWKVQDVLELLTVGTTMAVLWKLSAGVIKKKSFQMECPCVTFDEVIGMRAAKEQVLMYVRYLQAPEAFTRLGARMPKGCLLAGPPGTGKTYLAKAVAGTAGVPFFAASGSDFMELYVGQGARSVRELFQAARKAAPAVVFIDELDAVGSHRTTMDSSGEHTRTINQLLADMDGMALTNVVVFAATNRIDHLDAALLRPGRFDKVVHVELPSGEDREKLFEFYLSGLALVDPESDWRATSPTLHDAECSARERLAKQLAAATPNLTPAHISCICNEATLLAATEGAPVVRPAHFERAVHESLHGVSESGRPRHPKRGVNPSDPGNRRTPPLD